MDEGGEQVMSRRRWVGAMSVPVIAATLGSRLLGADARATETDRLRGARVFNVRDFGAKGDGSTLDSAAVQAAIDACNGEGGGTVLVPAGDFLVGTLELKSNVTLHLAANGRLLGSGRIEDYSAGKGIPRSNGNIVLLSAANADRITIEGRGTIDGQGAKFFNGHGDNTGPGQNSSEGYSQRPHLLVMYQCGNVVVRDVFLTASAYHCFRILQCQYVHLDGIRIHNRVNKNNDGFHINSSQYVHVANCDVACQDDACALFGSNKFVTVTNCTFSTRWSVFRFGGGECENITISNCILYEVYGCAIKMRFGGRRSRLENISFSNLIMNSVTGPISIGLDSTPRRRAASQAATEATTTPAATTAPAAAVVRNISFTGIRATVVAVGKQHADLPFKSEYRPGETRTCIVLNGVGSEMLQNISFTDVHVTYEGGGTAEEATREVPKIAGEYFEIGTPPAYGLYARNVRGLNLSNVRFEVTTADLRPAVVFDHVEDAAVTGLSAQGNPDAECVFRLADTRDVLLSAARVISPAATAVQVEGEKSGAITVDGGDFSKAAKTVAFVRGAGEQAVRWRG